MWYLWFLYVVVPCPVSPVLSIQVVALVVLSSMRAQPTALSALSLNAPHADELLSSEGWIWVMVPWPQLSGCVRWWFLFNWGTQILGVVSNKLIKGSLFVDMISFLDDWAYLP